MDRRIILVLGFILCFITAFGLGRITSPFGVRTEYLATDELQSVIFNTTNQMIVELEKTSMETYKHNVSFEYKDFPKDIVLGIWLEEPSSLLLLTMSTNTTVIYVSFTSGSVRLPIFWFPYQTDEGTGTILLCYPLG